MTKKEKLKKLQEAWSNFSFYFEAPVDEDDCEDAEAYRELEAAINDLCD